MYTPLSEYDENLTASIVDIAFKIHKALGPGMLESVYEKCFCYELNKRGISFKKQHYIDIVYDDELLMQDALKADILIDDRIIVELKAQEVPHPIWEAQLLSYLRLQNLRLGFLINFHVLLIKNGIKRFIL
jgi:GxxExxY protein